jgi:hypothetical protein
MFPWSLFGGESSIFINRLLDEMLWPTSRNGKVVRCTVPFKMSNLHYNWWEGGRLLIATINPPLEVPLPWYEWIYKMLFGQNRNKKQYEVIIGNFFACTCLDFVTMISSLLGQRRKWVPCEHMYYVLQHVIFCGQFESFIDFPTWSCDEIRHLLKCDVIFVTTPLWGKCEVATHTPENGTWESSGTPRNSKLNCRGQNTLHWGVLYIVGKVSKCRCLKWPCTSHSDICSTSYGWKKGRESNCQFDSRPLKVGNWPDPGVCRWSATHGWKTLKENYKFALDVVSIGG